MEEMGKRFAGSLVLSEREARGLKIGSSAAQAAVLFKYALVCKVLTQRFFRRRSFIDLFSRLWGGEKGVSISDVEDERFIARFSCEEDMQRVFDREPWDFDRSLIVMGRSKDVESVTDVVLSTAVFWIQAYGVPFRFRTPAVARDIGGLFGEFVDVKSDNEGSRVGRFIRIRVRMDVSIALLRQTVVDFPGSGEQLVAFKADMDLQGRRLGPRVSRGRTDVFVSGDGSDGGSGSGSWSRREDMGVTEKVGGLLQLKGPTQDTASSPVKKVEPKSKSKGVIIAERFVAQQRILQLEKL
ncbi:hypothetical protein M0R45_035211 [Rubus argutus]|uniref:DUF4283 domain-containing protein n=1 Tax=Rubus argutus TaxID=59490 RepID=A0AAW1VWA0_RUBAR